LHFGTHGDRVYLRFALVQVYTLDVQQAVPKMRVLVVGNGGREHALAWKLKQSPRLTRLWIAPGNAGTASEGENVAIQVDDVKGLVAFAKKESVDLVVVGPELPLSLGLTDALAEQRIRVFGPSRAAAQLESSKVFCKLLLRQADVPTADHQVFRDADKRDALCQSSVSK
jgi:phosphoribosylamine---glycine ligase